MAVNCATQIWARDNPSLRFVAVRPRHWNWSTSSGGDAKPVPKQSAKSKAAVKKIGK